MRTSIPARSEPIQIPSILLVPGQITAPQSIKSIQLYRKGSDGNAPIIELGSRQRLVLKFDELSTISGQFIVRFTHHNKNWNESNLPDSWVFEGNNELFIRGGVKNQLNRPEYFRYSFEFPSTGLNFQVSGHYMLHIFDYQSGSELFSLPFFVTENEGELTIVDETLFNQRNDGSAIDQLFGEFLYPEFVEFPQFDLSYSFVQNRFWKESKIASQTSFTTQGKTEFHLTRQNSFSSNFDFSFLNLSELSLQNSQIYNFEPARIPPRVILRDDVLNFLATPRIVSSVSGSPNQEATAKYADVTFRFNTGGRSPIDDDVYLIGDFNQWSISDRNKLRYNSDLKIFETKVLVKEGSYSYKYVTLANKEIEALRLSDSLSKKDQEYIGFVYYRDPSYQYDRILSTSTINSPY